MALRIAGLPVWVGPTELIAGARAVVGWTDEAVEVVAGLPQRVASLLDEVEGLVGRVSDIADRADSLVGRADGIVDSIDELLAGVRGSVTRVDAVVADVGALVGRIEPLLAEVHSVSDGAAHLVSRAGQVTDGAATIVTTAGGAADGAAEMVAVFQPLAQHAAPLAQRFVAEFSETELQAAIRLIDQLPQLTEHVETDIMPILATLDRVGPDVHQLLEVLEDVRLAIQGVPGFTMLRRRGENKEAEENED